MQTLKGHLLIATPQLQSPIFTRSVILMLDHNEEGALGVILNQQISTTMTDLSGKIFVEDFEWDKPISLGGPVASSLMMLHTNESLADQEIVPGVYITADGAKVQELIEQRSEPSLVVANYPGWGPGQLDGEIRARFVAYLARHVRPCLLVGRKGALERRRQPGQGPEADRIGGPACGAAGPGSELSWPLHWPDDLGGDLVGVVAARQSHQRLAVALAELLHISKRVARPADGQ